MILGFVNLEKCLLAADGVTFCSKGMKSSMKTQLAKLLAELLRYYHFDR